MQVYGELVTRGLATQITNEEETKKIVNEDKAVFYIGSDPTADSPHIGHFMALCLMKRLQMADSKSIALIGGDTGIIGDLSGRSGTRTMMTPETIRHNCDYFKKQMSRFVDFSEDGASMANNAKWPLELNYINFLREVGPHLSVSNMPRTERYKQRMEKGLSFLELNYMIMQSFDFCELFQRYGCNTQFGGNGQWSNMLGGTELIRRKLGKDAHAMTITLLSSSESKKMSKTQSGAVRPDPNRTSLFEFYQYWRNVADADIPKCLRMLTFLPTKQVNKMDRWEGSQSNEAKKIPAYGLISLVHGGKEVAKAQEGARALFESGDNTANMPTYQPTDEDFTDGAIDVSGVLQKPGPCVSCSEARGNVEQGGVSVDGNAVKDVKAVFSKDQLAGGGLMFKRDEKDFMRAIAE